MQKVCMENKPRNHFESNTRQKYIEFLTFYFSSFFKNKILKSLLKICLSFLYQTCSIFFSICLSIHFTLHESLFRPTKMFFISILAIILTKEEGVSQSIFILNQKMLRKIILLKIRF